MEDNNFSKESKLVKLIMKMTTTGKSELNFNHCKELKGYCKSSNHFVDIAFQKLWSQLKKPHSEIRLSCVQAINILFMRSFYLRSLILDNLIEYFELTIQSEKTLPPPVSASRKLKVESIQFFKEWHEKFSLGYKQLDLAMKYLKECKQISFENIQDNISYGHDTEIARVRLNKAVCDLDSVSEDIHMSIQELENCLNLLLPRPEEFDLLYKDQILKDNLNNLSEEFSGNEEDKDYYHIDEEEYNEIYERQQNSYSFHPVSNSTISLAFNKDEKIKIYESSDNRDLIVQLTEKLDILKKKYIVLVRQTLRIYSKYNAETSLVRPAAELKLKIQNVINKADKLFIIRKDVDDEEEDDFVEVPLAQTEINEVSQLMQLASSYEKHKATSLKSEIGVNSEETKSNQSQSIDTLPFNAKPWTVGELLPQKVVPKTTSSKPVKKKDSVPIAGTSREVDRDYWRDDVFDRKLSQAIGVDLTKDALKRRRRKGGLTDLKKIKKDTAKKRIIKLLKKKKNKQKEF